MSKAKEYEREVRAVTLERNKAEAHVQVCKNIHPFRIDCRISRFV